MNLKDKLKIFYNIIFKSINTNPLLFAKKSDVLFFNQGRKVKLNKLYYNTITSILNVELLKNGFSVTSINDFDIGIHYTPVIDKKGYFNWDFNYPLLYINRLFIGITMNGNEFEKFINKIIQDINLNFQVKLDSKYYINQLKYALAEQKYNSLVYKYIFKTINPKVVILSCYYNYQHLTLIKICKELGIKTIELQHGSIDNLHLAYNILDNEIITKFLPDYFFTWGNIWTKSIRFPIKKNHIISVGYPYIEKRVNELENYNVTNKKNLLFISQKNIDLLKLAVELNKIMNDDYEIVYKLHPTELYQWKETCIDYLNSDISIISDNENDIFYYINKADFVISINSTTLFEAAAFDKTICIYKIGDSHQRVSMLFDYEKTYIFENANELYDIITNIDNNHHSNRKVNSSLNKEDYFKIDSLKNIENEINKIIKCEVQI